MHYFPAVQSLLSFSPEAWQKSRARCAPKIFPYRRDFSRKAGPEGKITALQISLPSQALCPPAPARPCSPWTASPSLQEARVLSWSLLGCPSCKDRDMLSSSSSPATLLLGWAMVNRKCRAWHRLGWVTRALIIFLGKCRTDVWKNHDVSLGRKEDIWEQHETKFKGTYLEGKNNTSLAVTACVVTAESEDREHLHLGHLRSLVPLLFSWLVNLSFPGL